VGILEALHRARGPVLACGCDLPFVTAELAGWLASLSAPLVVPRVGGRVHPLLARYAPDLSDSLAAALAVERPLAAAIEAIGPRYVEEEELLRFGDPGRLLANVNTPDDLARAERLLAAG
jgi:molybdenum cofactor guanylyltransferase